MVALRQTRRARASLSQLLQPTKNDNSLPFMDFLFGSRVAILLSSTRSPQIQIATGDAMEQGNRKGFAPLLVMQPATLQNSSSGCASKGGSGKSSCGAAAGQGDLAP
jgi:hypothetical protein